MWTDYDKHSALSVSGFHSCRLRPRSTRDLIFQLPTVFECSALRFLSFLLSNLHSMLLNFLRLLIPFFCVTSFVSNFHNNILMFWHCNRCIHLYKWPFQLKKYFTKKTAQLIFQLSCIPLISRFSCMLKLWWLRKFTHRYPQSTMSGGSFQHRWTFLRASWFGGALCRCITQTVLSAIALSFTIAGSPTDTNT